MVTCERCANSEGWLIQQTSRGPKARRCDHRSIIERRWWDDERQEFAEVDVHLRRMKGHDHGREDRNTT
jgi:hypothetical protein